MLVAVPSVADTMQSRTDAAKKNSPNLFHVFKQGKKKLHPDLAVPSCTARCTDRSLTSLTAPRPSIDSCEEKLATVS